MNTLDLGRASQDRELRDDELGAVSGGNEGYPALPLGSNISDIFELSLWDYVGATGHLPGPGAFPSISL